MGGSVAWLCHYKAGLAGSFSKHFSNGAVKTKRNPELSAGSLKPNSPTLGSRHLSESEMATFVSVSFPATCFALHGVYILFECSVSYFELHKTVGSAQASEKL